MDGSTNTELAGLIGSYIDSKKDAMLRDLARLVQIPSVREQAAENMPFGEPAAAALGAALEIASGHGLTVKNYDNYIGAADLGEGETALAILAHLDVVPEGSGWSRDPFRLTIEGGRAYGRGTIDDKGPAVAALYAMLTVRDLGLKLRGGVRLLLGCAEETGSEDLAYYRKKEKMPPMLLTPDGNFPVIQIEKGGVSAEFSADIKPEPSGPRVVSLKAGFVSNAVPDRAEAVVAGIDAQTLEAAARGCGFSGVSFEISDKTLPSGEPAAVIKASGRSAHASKPELGANALTGLLGLLKRLDLVDAVSKYLSALAELFPHGETDGAAAGLKCSDPESGELTLAFSMLNYGGTCGSSLNGCVDIRFPACSNFDGIKGTLQSALEAKGFRAAAIRGREPHIADRESPFIKTLLSAYERVTGEPGYCLVMGGATYAHGIEGGVAYGAEFPGDENNMHGADESVEIEKLLKCAKIYANAIAMLLGE